MNIPDLPLADAVSLGSGDTFAGTAAINGLPTIHLNDGPNGVRKQAGDADALGLAPSLPATCFPPLTALGQSWDTELIHRVGAALGDEAQASTSSAHLSAAGTSSTSLKIRTSRECSARRGCEASRAAASERP
jgi:hypothetical protein